MNNTTVKGVNSSSNMVDDDVIFDDNSTLLLTDGQPGRRSHLGGNL